MIRWRPTRLFVILTKCLTITLFVPTRRQNLWEANKFERNAKSSFFDITRKNLLRKGVHTFLGIKKKNIRCNVEDKNDTIDHHPYFTCIHLSSLIDHIPIESYNNFKSMLKCLRTKHYGKFLLVKSCVCNVAPTHIIL